MSQLAEILLEKAKSIRPQLAKVYEVSLSEEQLKAAFQYPVPRILIDNEVNRWNRQNPQSPIFWWFDESTRVFHFKAYALGAPNE